METPTSSIFLLESCKEINWRHIRYNQPRLRTSKGHESNQPKLFHSKKKKKKMRRYPTENITLADSTYYRVLLVNTASKVESLLPSLKQADGATGLYENVNKTIRLFKPKNVIST